jgi:hypothetical protein
MIQCNVSIGLREHHEAARRVVWRSVEIPSVCGGRMDVKSWRTGILVPTFGVFVCGCQEAQPNNVLDGQWVVELTVPEAVPGAGLRRTTGVLVFHRALPKYPDDDPDTAIAIGRGYIEFAPLAGLALGRRSGGPTFGTWEGADRGETVHAKFDGDSIKLDLAPHINDFDPLLRGRLTNDTIRGAVQITGHPTQRITGFFQMWRVRRDSFSDSAVARARRGVRQWEQP